MTTIPAPVIIAITQMEHATLAPAMTLSHVMTGIFAPWMPVTRLRAIAPTFQEAAIMATLVKAIIVSREAEIVFYPMTIRAMI